MPMLSNTPPPILWKRKDKGKVYEASLPAKRAMGGNGCLDDMRVREIVRRVKGGAVWCGGRNEGENGYGKLEGALRQAVGRARAVDLDGKWREVGEYLGDFGDYECDVRLAQEVGQALGDLADPEVICTMIKRILTQTTTHRPGLAPAVHSITTALYDLMEYIESFLSSRDLEASFNDIMPPEVSSPASPRLRRMFSFSSFPSERRHPKVLETCIRIFNSEVIRRAFASWRWWVNDAKETQRMRCYLAEQEKRIKEARLSEKRMVHKVEDLQREVSFIRRENSKLTKVAAKNERAMEEVAKLAQVAEMLRVENNSLVASNEKLEERVRVLEEASVKLQAELSDARRMLYEVSRQSQTGTCCEIDLQDELIEVIDASPEDVPTAHILKKCILRIIEKTPLECLGDTTLNVDEGFLRPEHEVNAMLVAAHRLAPQEISQQELEAAFRTVTIEGRATTLLEWLTRMDIYISSGAEQLAADDGKGLARHELYSTVVCRILDDAYDRTLKQTPLRWHADYSDYRMYNPDSSKSVAMPELDSFVLLSPRNVKSLPTAQRSFGVYNTLAARRSVLQNRRLLFTSELVAELLCGIRDPEAEELTPAEKRDVRLFTNVTSSMVEGVAQSEEDDDAADQLYDLLVSNYRPLRRIFKFYSNTELIKKVETLRAAQMSRSDVVRLLDDCYVTTEVASYWPADVQEGLSPQEFIELLVRMSQKITLKNGVVTSPDEEGAHVDIEALAPLERVRLFVERVMIPNACYVTTSAFKAAIYHVNMRGVLSEFRSVMQKIFVFYASGKGTNDTISQSSKEVKELSYKEFRQLMTDTKMYDEVCTQYVIQMLFTKMQDDYDLACTFKEFVEILCAISVYKNPAPYIPVHFRFRSFLLEKFLPHLTKKVNISLDTKATVAKTRPTRPWHSVLSTQRGRRKTGQAVIVAAINKRLRRNASMKFVVPEKSQPEPDNSPKRRMSRPMAL